MALPYDLGVNLAAALIGYGVAVGRTLFRERHSSRNARRFWLSGSKRRLAVIYPLYRGEHGNRFPQNMARIEDIAAAQMIAEAAEAVGRQPFLANHDEPIDSSTDRVLICSPKGNWKSAEAATSLRLPFGFEVYPDRPSEIVNIESHTRYVCDTASTGTRNDFAILARVSDSATGRITYLLWGIRGIGTLGAARFASHSPLLAEVNRQAGERDFAMVLRVGYEDALKPQTVVPESQVLLLPG